MTPCPPPFPANPPIAEQFYARNGNQDCPALNAVVPGCQIQMEGAYNVEWRDWGSFNWSPFPNFGFTGDCHTGTHCVDTTLSSGFAAVQIGWVQSIAVSQFPAGSTFKFWAKCIAGPCTGITFGINNPCALVSSSPALTLTNTWAEYTVPLDPLMATCATSFNVIRLSSPPGNR